MLSYTNRRESLSTIEEAVSSKNCQRILQGSDPSSLSNYLAEGLKGLIRAKNFENTSLFFQKKHIKIRLFAFVAEVI